MNDVERVFHHLVNILSQDDPERLRSPIEISEIYQSILPYRRYRSLLEFDTNQDYEMALLRFLSGEGGLASLDPPEAQDALEEEARSVNPNPGAFRDYAAAKVYLNTRAVQSVAYSHEAYAPPEPSTPPPPASPPPLPPIPPSFDFPMPSAESITEAATVPFAPTPAEPSARERPSTGAASFEQVVNPPTPAPAPPVPVTDQCQRCGGELPAGREARYCPHCGANQRARQCDECGADVEPEWKFCITCGRGTATGG